MHTPPTCVITGSFTHRKQPARGLVRFTPSRLWVVLSGITWACLAPDVQLGPDGSFVARVTATDCDPIPWTYYICTPAGCYETYVPLNDAGWSLRELVHEHRVGTGTSHRR
jgi:hypothetical protein